MTLEAGVAEIRSCLEQAGSIINHLEVAAQKQDINEFQQLLEQLKPLYQQALVSLAKHTAAEMEPKKVVDLPPFLKGGRK